MVKSARLPKKFRGLKAKEVDKYLQDLQRRQAEETEKLEKQVEDCQAEKDRLQKRLKELQELRAKKTLPQEELEFALLRAKEAILLLRRKADEEIDEVAAKTDKDNRINREKIKSIEDEIQNIKTHIQFLIDNIISIFKEPGKETEQPVTNVIQFNEKINGKKSGQEKHIKEQAILEEEQKITADGTSVTDISKPFKTKDETLNFKKMMDNLARVLKKPETDELPALDLPVQDNDVNEVSSEIAATKGEEPATPVEEAITDIENSNAKSNVAETGSPAVTAEITNLRYKHIIGKVAGQDLLDYNGRKIIAKGETITAEAVGIAEREGKLPELIIHIALPGMDE